MKCGENNQCKGVFSMPVKGSEGEAFVELLGLLGIDESDGKHMLAHKEASDAPDAVLDKLAAALIEAGWPESDAATVAGQLLAKRSEGSSKKRKSKSGEDKNGGNEVETKTAKEAQEAIQVYAKHTRQDGESMLDAGARTCS